MGINRRDLFKLAFAGGGATLLTPSVPAWSSSSVELNPDRWGMLVDTTRCIGCRHCEWACKKQNELPSAPLAQFSDTSVFEALRRPDATSYTVVNRFAGPKGEGSPVYAKVQCMHCDHPACVSACLVGAFEKVKTGSVQYDGWKCMGCRYCMVACPFNVPRFEWNEPVPKVQKCNMCIERLEKGEPTACTQACPNEATICGTREELLAEAHRRIEESPEDYNPHVFGESELGGTSVLLLAPSEIESLAFMEGMSDQPMPQLTRKVLEKIPGLVVMGGATLLALYWITHRRNEVARFEALEAQHDAEKESDDARK